MEYFVLFRIVISPLYVYKFTKERLLSTLTARAIKSVAKALDHKSESFVPAVLVGRVEIRQKLLQFQLRRLIVGFFGHGGSEIEITLIHAKLLFIKREDTKKVVFMKEIVRRSSHRAAVCILYNHFTNGPTTFRDSDSFPLSL